MSGLEDDIDIIKSLIAMCKEGYLPLEKVDSQYREITDSRLDFRKYGYSSLVAMLQSSPQIKLCQRPEGTVLHVNDEKMSHVTSLIQKQKVPKKRSSSRKSTSFRSRSSYQASNLRSASQQRSRYNRTTSHYEPTRRPFQPTNRSTYNAPKRIQSPGNQKIYQSGTSRPESREQPRFENSRGPSRSGTFREQPSPAPYRDQSRSGMYGEQSRCKTYSDQPNSSIYREQSRYGTYSAKPSSASYRDQSSSANYGGQSSYGTARKLTATSLRQDTGSTTKHAINRNCDITASSLVSSTSHVSNRSNVITNQSTCEYKGRHNVNNSLNPVGRLKKTSSSSGWSSDSSDNGKLSGQKAEEVKTVGSSHPKSNGMKLVKESVRISYSSEWTSDSEGADSQDHTSFSPKKLIPDPPSSLKQSSRVVICNQSVHQNNTVSELRSKQNVETFSSDSEWSSETSLPSRHENSKPVLQNGQVSSTSKSDQEASPKASSKSAISQTSYSFGARDVRIISEGSERGNAGEQSSTSKGGSECDSSPLMTGGVGRGKLRYSVQYRKPGGCNPALSNQNSSSVMQTASCMDSNLCSKGIAVTGSPSKREAAIVSRNGIKSIAVTVPNEQSAVSSQHFPNILLRDGPSFNGYPFVGDRFLLEVARVALGCKVYKSGPVSYCGLCRENLTIAECEKELVKNGVPKQIVIMIGMTDILKGASLQEMKDQTTSLIQKLKHLVLITVPAPPSFLKDENKSKLTVLLAYNKWLLSLKSVHTVINVDDHLYCDRQYFRRVPGRIFETLSEGGCSNVMHEIVSVVS